MSEKIKSSSGVESTSWDELSKLNQKFPGPARKPDPDLAMKIGKNYGFREQAEEYHRLGDKMIPRLNKAAKEATGIRDGQDLGEYLHEKASWQEQIKMGVWNLEFSINDADDELNRSFPGMFENNLRTARSGSTEKKMSEEDFLIIGGHYADIPSSMVEQSVQALVPLVIGRDVNSPNPDERSREALNSAVTKLWLDETRKNSGRLKQKKEGPTYKLVEYAIKAREAVKDGSYKVLVDEGQPLGFKSNRTYRSVSMEEADALKANPTFDGPHIVDIRDSKLYEMVDKIMSTYDDEQDRKSSGSSMSAHSEKSGSSSEQASGGQRGRWPWWRIHRA